MTREKKINTFRAFRSRNYALYFGGQSVSQIGTWMQRTGVYWVVYSMTHSPLMLGLTTFATQFPSFLFSLPGGILSDRHNRYKIMLITQIAAMVQAVILAVLVLTNHYNVTVLLILSVFLGIINAFDIPARLPLVYEMISDKDDLPNALALNSSLNNIARLIGPALSGIVLEKFGAGICFLVNAISFMAVISSLLAMKLPPYKPMTQKKKPLTDMKDGFNYIKNTRAIGTVILMLSLVSLLVLPYNTLLPIFAKVIFAGNAATFGYINSFIGLGAVCGAFFLASIKPETDLKMTLLISTVLLSLSLILFSHVTSFPLAMVFATLCGFGTMSQTTICNTIIQVEAEQKMRGRVLSFLAMSIYGMLPLGSLFIGAVARHIGAPNTMLWQGLITLLIVAIFYKFLREEHYKKKNKLQLEVAENEAAEMINR